MPTPLPYWTFDLIEDRILDWVAQKPLDGSLPSLFEESWVKNQTSRSALSGEHGLLKARRRVRKAIKSLNSRKSSKAQTACFPEHSMTDGQILCHMDEALSAFLQLPITPIQDLPTDILLEIIRCAVLMDSRSTSDQLKWCLVSKDVFMCRYLWRNSTPTHVKSSSTKTYRLVTRRRENMFKILLFLETTNMIKKISPGYSVDSATSEFSYYTASRILDSPSLILHFRISRGSMPFLLSALGWLGLTVSLDPISVHQSFEISLTYTSLYPIQFNECCMQIGNGLSSP
ncbi:hypothetical protein DL96DRAFT_1651796 [Flagelloscypha sp. PMI_526]|nr:hypothetical protein DL96DRAFT_1651796 [Flagelloscypha sp. PMI_526]